MGGSFESGPYSGPRDPEPTRFATALEVLKALLSNITTPVERMDYVISQAVQYADALRDRIKGDLMKELETRAKASEEAKKKAVEDLKNGPVDIQSFIAQMNTGGSNQASDGDDSMSAAFNPLR